MSTDPTRLAAELANRSAAGWRVVSQTEAGVQFAKPRQWSRLGLILFVVVPLLGALFWLPLAGVAMLGLILVVADYLLKKEQLEFVPASGLAAPVAGRAFARPAGAGFVCSACGASVAHDAAQCPQCKASLRV